MEIDKDGLALAKAFIFGDMCVRYGYKNIDEEKANWIAEGIVRSYLRGCRNKHPLVINSRLHEADESRQITASDAFEYIEIPTQKP